MGSAKRARAKETSCRWPSESPLPLSLTTVSYPSGIFSMKQVGAHGPAGLPHFLHRRVGPAKADVVGDGPREEKGVLQDDADLRPERVELHVLHVVTVDHHPARRHIVKAADQVDDRRLSRARRPDQRHGLPGLRRAGRRRASAGRPFLYSKVTCSKRISPWIGGRATASGRSATLGWVSMNSKIRSDEAIACSTWL